MSSVTPISPECEDKSEASLAIHRNYSINRSVLLPLSMVSQQMAETLYLNYYEVNTILRKYLEMWQQNPSTVSIPLVQYLQMFPDTYHGIVKSFFIEKGITYDQYFLFVCTFLFFQTPQIIHVMLSVAHIYSNVFITRSQINEFFRCYCLSEEPYHDLLSVLKEASAGSPTLLPDDSYFIKEFISYFEHSLHFSGFLFSLQYILVNTSMTQKIYTTIKRKIYIFYHTCSNANNNHNNSNGSNSKMGKNKSRRLSGSFSDYNSMNSYGGGNGNNNNNNNNNNNIIVPPEPICSKLCRLLFTHEPPPFHYDFCLRYPNDHSFETMIHLVRQNIAPDVRCSSSARETFKNSSRYKKTTSSNNNRSLSKRNNSLLTIPNAKSVLFVKPSQDGSQVASMLRKK